MSNPVIVLVAASLGIGQIAPPAPPPPPPPLPPIVTAHGGAPRPEPHLLRWMPGPVRCADRAVEGAPIRRPLNTLFYGDREPAPLTLRFEIAADGRPMSIARDGPPFVMGADDLLPAFSASRFPAGARTGCTVTYRPERVPLGEAPVADLVSYTISPRSGRLPRSGWDRIRQPGTCTDLPRPAALLRAMPDFPKIAGTPGVQDWSLVAYDTDTAGKPVKVRVAESTGNRALDAAAVKAMRASRFSQGARTGCIYPYWRAAESLPAPPIPDNVAAPAATCPEGRDWQTPPTLTFPEPYGRRRIEGWAVVRYDVAPWGEIGNVSVVAAQPTADFGRQAERVVRSARFRPSAAGRSGCTDRVLFKMPPADTPPPEVEEAIGIY